MIQIPSNHYFYCFNPSCRELQPQNAKEFCISCGSKLLLQERFHAVRLLGQGRFGRTFLALDRLSSNSTLCAIKQLWYGDLGVVERVIVELQKDIKRLDKLGNHSQIPLLLESFYQDGCLYLVQEYIHGQNLANVLAERGRLNAQSVWQILESLLPVLKFIHAGRIVHGDIKPENLIKPSASELLLLDRAFLDLVLVDFGTPKLSN